METNEINVIKMNGVEYEVVDRECFEFNEALEVILDGTVESGGD